MRYSEALSSSRRRSVFCDLFDANRLSCHVRHETGGVYSSLDPIALSQFECEAASVFPEADFRLCEGGQYKPRMI